LSLTFKKLFILKKVCSKLRHWGIIRHGTALFACIKRPHFALFDFCTQNHLSKKRQDTTHGAMTPRLRFLQGINHAHTTTKIERPARLSPVSALLHTHTAGLIASFARKYMAMD